MEIRNQSTLEAMLEDDQTNPSESMELKSMVDEYCYCACLFKRSNELPPQDLLSILDGRKLQLVILLLKPLFPCATLSVLDIEVNSDNSIILFDDFLHIRTLGNSSVKIRR